jgi:signal transduction histidine kinase/CheY-like chemotaxis protein
MFFTPFSYVHQVFLAFVLLGMVSGSISTLSSSRGAFLVFLLTALIPYGARLVSVRDPVHVAMAGMTLVYVAVMGKIGNRLYRTITESLRLRFANLELLESLTHARDAIKQSHSELERRVEDRTAKLQESEEALRHADRRKNEFLAMLGHELRNPLAPIRNALDVMNNPGATETESKAAREIIDRQSDRLRRLVDDLLDVSRIVYGKISLQMTDLQIGAVINHAVEGSLPLIHARRQRLTVNVPDEPFWIKGDVVRLDQVISNLLNNAAKYSSEEARIELTVEASERWVTVRVRDDGIGISPELLPYVFELFAQADHSLARTQGGLGIGLTVVKRLVQMHGGTAEAHSDGPGRGAEFVIRLPRQAAPVKTEERATTTVPTGPAESARIMVVDDNQDAVEMLATLLRLEGYSVAVAYDGVSALAEAELFRPQLMLLDVGMPGMDGYQVARELRARPSTRDMIIIALTGYGQPEDRAMAKEAGFTDHLTKPVDPKSLRAMLQTHLLALR